MSIEHEFDPTKTDAEIQRAAKLYRNWGRWGDDDRWGTVNFIDDAKRKEAAGLIKRGRSFSLSAPFDQNGPQKGWRRRTNPSLFMMDTGTDAYNKRQGFPHGFGGADDFISMPLSCSTQWDGLGHIFDYGKTWNGKESFHIDGMGDHLTGIQNLADKMVSRGVLLDVGRSHGTDTELPDGFAIKTQHILECIEQQGPSAKIRRGDIVLIRTGAITRAMKLPGWGSYAGGDAPGLSFSTLRWFFESEIAAAATDTWGFEVRPNELADSFQPMHQVLIPNMGLTIGEIWYLDELAADCSEDGRYDFFLSAPPLKITGAVSSPVNPIAVK
jgi:kynurenine formamidase